MTGSHGPEFPSGCSINDGISQNTYLGEYFKLQLPQIDRLVEFTLKKGRNCLVSKKDLCRAYCQFPIDPKDYHLIGCHYQGKFYFVTRPFSLHSSALIFQCTTKAIVHIFPKQGFLADVYLGDSYGAKYPFLAASAFSQLSQLFHQLGLDSAPDRDSPPSTSMICPTVAFPLEVPTISLMDLQAKLTTCQAASFFTKKQLQSPLGKLSFLTACVKPGIIFMAQLLNSLRECKRPARHRYPISATLISCSTFVADSF